MSQPYYSYRIIDYHTNKILGELTAISQLAAKIIWLQNSGYAATDSNLNMLIAERLI